MGSGAGQGENWKDWQWNCPYEKHDPESQWCVCLPRKIYVKGWEGSLQSGKRGLTGFYKMQLDIVWGLAVCVVFTEYPEWLWGWLLWIDVLCGWRSFVSEFITIPLLQIKLRADAASARVSNQSRACCVLGQLWSCIKTTRNTFLVLTLF